MPSDPDRASAPRDRLRAPARGAGQQSLRAHNLALVLAHVLEAPTPVSRAAVAAATGLTRATVSALVEQLLTARLVSELPTVPGLRAGRPAVPLVAARGTVAALGMEINVDYLGLCAVDVSGAVLAERVERDDFRASDPEPVVARLAALAAEVAGELAGRGTALVGTALALPGLVDSVVGPLRLAPNLGWRDVDLLTLVAAHPLLASLPPRLGNEADLAAVAESRARRTSGPRSFVYVSGEVGIGGALVIDGELFRGAHGWGGEIGHVAVGTDGSFEAGGSLEAYAGQDALLAAAGLPRDAAVGALLSGGPQASAALDRAADAIGLVLAAVMNVVDVNRAVLGGIYAGLADRLGPRITAQLERRVISAPWSGVTVEAAVADRYPAMRGGALWVLDAVLADPAGWLGSEDVEAPA